VCDRGPEGVAALASGIDMELEIYTVRHAEPAARPYSKIFYPPIVAEQ